MRSVLVLCVALLATACGDSDDVSPSVDWREVTQAQRTVINRVVSEGDCEGMQAAFNATEAADVLAYLQWHMEDAGC